MPPDDRPRRAHQFRHLRRVGIKLESAAALLQRLFANQAFWVAFAVALIML